MRPREFHPRKSEEQKEDSAPIRSNSLPYLKPSVSSSAPVLAPGLFNSAHNDGSTLLCPSAPAVRSAALSEGRVQDAALQDPVAGGHGHHGPALPAVHERFRDAAPRGVVSVRRSGRERELSRPERRGRAHVQRGAVQRGRGHDARGAGPPDELVEDREERAHAGEDGDDPWERAGGESAAGAGPQGLPAAGLQQRAGLQLPHPQGRRRGRGPTGEGTGQRDRAALPGHEQDPGAAHAVPRRARHGAPWRARLHAACGGPGYRAVHRHLRGGVGQPAGRQVHPGADAGPLRGAAGSLLREPSRYARAAGSRRGLSAHERRPGRGPAGLGLRARAAGGRHLARCGLPAGAAAERGPSEAAGRHAGAAADAAAAAAAGAATARAAARDARYADGPAGPQHAWCSHEWRRRWHAERDDGRGCPYRAGGRGRVHGHANECQCHERANGHGLRDDERPADARRAEEHAGERDGHGGPDGHGHGHGHEPDARPAHGHAGRAGDAKWLRDGPRHAPSTNGHGHGHEHGHGHGRPDPAPRPKPRPEPSPDESPDAAAAAAGPTARSAGTACGGSDERSVNGSAKLVKAVRQGRPRTRAQPRTPRSVSQRQRPWQNVVHCVSVSFVCASRCVLDRLGVRAAAMRVVFRPSPASMLRDSFGFPPGSAAVRFGEMAVPCYKLPRGAQGIAWWL
eukprot:scaffold6084_cov267-Pinguiococcus_pyrenoidosus.AAC.2